MVLQEPGQVLNPAARHAAVLGSPISHSLSPALHTAAYRALGLSHWSYGAQEVRAPALRGFVAGLGPAWAGLSLTMPLKEAAFEVADEVSDLAREVGAINTLVRRPDGGWSADNTDVYGVSQALRGAGWANVSDAVVLGSGATARSVVAALATLGCSKVTFAVRSVARQETVDQARRAGLEVVVVGLGQVADVLSDTRLVVSTLPATALPDREPHVHILSETALSETALSETALAEAALSDSLLADLLPPGSRLTDHLLLDVVYAGWPTPLARMFQAAGAGVVSGLEMLVHQAAEQVRLMTGLCPPVDEMRAAGLAAMASR
jgi:shikimate dehydrogenase